VEGIIGGTGVDLEFQAPKAIGDATGGRGSTCSPHLWWGGER
jgi:hypothetical protein